MGWTLEVTQHVSGFCLHPHCKMGRFQPEVKRILGSNPAPQPGQLAWA